MLAGCCRLFTCRKWVCMNYSPNRDHSSWQEPDGVVAAWDAVVRCWCHWACSFDLSQESHASSSLYVVKRALLTCAKKLMRPPLHMSLFVLFWLVPRKSCVLLFVCCWACSFGLCQEGHASSSSYLPAGPSTLSTRMFEGFPSCLPGWFVWQKRTCHVLLPFIGDTP